MKEIFDKAYDEKISQLFPLVKSIALKYASNNHPLEDLMQEGMIGVIKAVDNFDDSKDTKFSTYAVFWIKKYILDYIAKDSNLAFSEYNENQHDISYDSIQTTSSDTISIDFPPAFPALEKQVIIQLYQHEFTLSEVAKQLKLPRERVRQLREKALRRLKSHGFKLDQTTKD
jgi:RNA polymerase sigma factor (sigma-70 family)